MQIEPSDETLANLSLGGLLKAHGILPDTSNPECLNEDLQQDADILDLHLCTDDLLLLTDVLDLSVTDLGVVDLDPSAAPVPACDDPRHSSPCKSPPVQAKPSTACSNTPSVNEDFLVDYSKLAMPLSPPGAVGDPLEAPLSPCIQDSPAKHTVTNDSGYLSSTGTSPTSSAPSLPSPQCDQLVLTIPDQKALESVHRHWSPLQPNSAPPSRTAERPEDSYTAMIGRALLSSREGEMVLGDIYAYILEHYPYFQQAKSTWRSAVRHNLSVMECFVRGRRARSGRGFYWSLHPACVDRFRQGMFSRRMARQAALHYGKSMPRASAATRRQPYPSSTARPSHHATPQPAASHNPPATLHHGPLPSCGYVTMTSTPIQPSNHYNVSMVTTHQMHTATQAQYAQMLGHSHYGHPTHPARGHHGY